MQYSSRQSHNMTYIEDKKQAEQNSSDTSAWQQYTRIKDHNKFWSIMSWASCTGKKRQQQQHQLWVNNIWLHVNTYKAQRFPESKSDMCGALFNLEQNIFPVDNGQQWTFILGTNTAGPADQNISTLLC